VDCGGKRSVTPFIQQTMALQICAGFVRAKAPSPLRSAGAVQNESQWDFDFQPKVVKFTQGSPDVVGPTQG